MWLPGSSSLTVAWQSTQRPAKISDGKLLVGIVLLVGGVNGIDIDIDIIADLSRSISRRCKTSTHDIANIVMIGMKPKNIWT
jgi:hypothetical protein